MPRYPTYFDEPHVPRRWWIDANRTNELDRKMVRELARQIAKLTEPHNMSPEERIDGILAAAHSACKQQDAATLTPHSPVDGKVDTE